MKELHTFSRGTQNYALDVEDMSFFEVSNLARDILERYPDLSDLNHTHNEYEIGQTLTALEQSGVLDECPPQDAEVIRKHPPVTALELCLIEELSGRDIDHLLRRSVDFLHRQPGRHQDCLLTVQMAEKTIPEYILDSLKKIGGGRDSQHRRALHVSLSLMGITDFQRLANQITDTKLKLELHVPAFQLERFAGFAEKKLCPPPLLSRTALTIDYDGRPLRQLEKALDAIGVSGFRHVHIDFLCAACKHGESGLDVADPEVCTSLADNLCRAFTPDVRAESHCVVNHIPFGMAILTSQKNMHGCGAGNRYMALDLDGNLYPCRMYCGQSDLCLGNLDSGIDSLSRSRWIVPTTDRADHCRDCCIRYLCGGSSIRGKKMTAGICRIQSLLAEHAMVEHSRLGLEQKARLMGVYLQLQKILATRPYYYPQCRRQNTPAIERKLTVNGKSMRPILKAGDVVMVRPVTKTKPAIGDIVCFGKPATCHRVVWKWKQNGDLFIWEKGDNSILGSRIPAESITGIVTVIIKPKRRIQTTRFPWPFINRTISLVSLLTLVFVGTLYKKRRKK